MQCRASSALPATSTGGSVFRPPEASDSPALVRVYAAGNQSVAAAFSNGPVVNEVCVGRIVLQAAIRLVPNTRLFALIPDMVNPVARRSRRWAMT